MGLFNNLLISVIHLAFVVMDILMLMILIKVIYRRWRFEWLRLLNSAVEPVTHCVTDYLGIWIREITGKTYSEKTLLILLVVCLIFVRLVICGLE